MLLAMASRLIGRLSALSETDLERLSKAVSELDQDLVEKLTRELLEKNVAPSIIIEKGLVKGIREIGRKYECGEFFLSELMYGANVFNAGYLVLEPLMKKTSEQKRATVVLGTVAGDIHSIGKDILKAMLIAEGFAVQDLGVDVPADIFVKAIKDSAAEIVGVSTLLTSCLSCQQELMSKLKREGLRAGVKIFVGGAATTESWAKELGADGWAATAVEGVRRIAEARKGSAAN
jgi:methanogenic corrinoid protein MtbC1